MTRRTALTLLAAQQKRIGIRGIYSSPRPFWDKGLRLSDFGVNAVFAGGGSITPALMERATDEGARVFAEFPTLNGKGYVEKHPEAWPINEHGERAPAATWFLGACPTEAGFRAFRMKQLEDLLTRHDLAGVWMDYFHWHAQFEDPHPVLPDTCFCDACIAAFEKAIGAAVPPGAESERARWILTSRERQWRDWRVDHLNGWARDIKAALHRIRPGALLGVYHCPWTDTEFRGARRSTLGIDFDKLAGIVDVFSPMVYHGRMERPPEWVGENVGWLSRAIGKRARIWPIVQAADGPRPVSAGEFESVLRHGASGDATGVMMFTAHAVVSDPAKLEALRRLYTAWAAL